MPIHQECITLFCSVKAGSTITKVKLFVIDTTNPSRRTQVFAPASIASGSVDSSVYSITEIILCSMQRQIQYVHNLPYVETLSLSVAFTQ